MAAAALAAFVAAAPAFAATPTSSVPTTSSALSTTTLSTTTTSAPTTALKDPFAPATVASPRAAATTTVSIVDFGFSPATVTVVTGSTVTWTNTGAVIHSVTSDTGAFDSSPGCPSGPCIDPGASYSHVFAQAGRFAYHCKVHPNMTGTVVVNAAATTTTASPGSATPGSGNPPVSAGATPSTAARGTGNDLAFTGASGRELWIAFGALATITLGLALRPRRRAFPEHR
jgi:plastocyanin